MLYCALFLFVTSWIGAYRFYNCGNSVQLRSAKESNLKASKDSSGDSSVTRIMSPLVLDPHSNILLIIFTMNSKYTTADSKSERQDILAIVESGVLNFSSEAEKREFREAVEYIMAANANYDEKRKRKQEQKQQKIEKSKREQEKKAQKEKYKICHTESQKRPGETKNAGGIFTSFKRAFGILPPKKQSSKPSFIDLESALLLSEQEQNKDESGEKNGSINNDNISLEQ